MHVKRSSEKYCVCMAESLRLHLRGTSGHGCALCFNSQDYIEKENHAVLEAF